MFVICNHMSLYQCKYVTDRVIIIHVYRDDPVPERRQKLQSQAHPSFTMQ